MSKEIEPFRAPIPVVRRASEMARVAAATRAAREAQILATPLPTAEPDEVLIIIFHRLFRAPRDPGALKRYTYVATYRHETGKWFLSHDASHQPHRAYDNRDLLLFAKPVGPPIKVSDSGTVPSGAIPVIRAQVWFLPTEATR